MIDTKGSRYYLNFTKPVFENRICLGKPGRLKSWYQRKGFDDQQIDSDTWIYFQYTGIGNEFLILTEYEYEKFSKQIKEVQSVLKLQTWAGRSKFSYSGSVAQGTKIIFGNGFSAIIKASQYSNLLRYFKGKTVDIGTSFTDPPRGSVGEWLQKNVTKTAMASYVGPILICEHYAVRVGNSQIKFIK